MMHVAVDRFRLSNVRFVLVGALLGMALAGPVLGADLGLVKK
jgi:hypothetical protein